MRAKGIELGHTAKFKDERWESLDGIYLKSFFIYEVTWEQDASDL